LTPLAALLRDEIARHGPISFERFMDAALYHPEHGYYRRARDPFGKHGDFFTASQLQPVFGMLARRAAAAFAAGMGDPPDFTVVELGAGRREMAEAFSQWRYVGVDAGEEMPERFRGLVFANELFDALPIGLPGRRVGFEGGKFVWIPTDGPWMENRPRDEDVIAAIAQRLEEGFALIIDYGYVEAERARFPEGTLMSYRRHTASADVLSDPGERDITAHVNFTGLMDLAKAHRFEVVSFETLAQWIARHGEADHFAEVLTGGESHRLQLKTLLFGMGETFRVLALRKSAL
jgi:SAM-dependent MidA family methyltransferase